MTSSRPDPTAARCTASVVIPAFTLDRWSLITAAVESARNQTRQPEAVILCIDNNEELLRRARRHWADAADPPVRVIPNEFSEHLAERGVHERAHGTSRRFGAGTARNTGAREVESDVIAFLDDDASAEHDWLEMLLPLYDDPGVVAVGGAALPRYETDRPKWFPENFDWIFGCSYAGLPDTTAPLQHLVGSNMSVRRLAFSQLGGFLGSDFDDLNLCMRLVHAYGRDSVIYNPRAVAHHFVPDERVTWRYFYRRCYFVNREKVGVLSRIGPAANLQAEREFVRRAVLHEARKSLGRVSRGDMSAVPQFGAMVAGVALAGLGYGHGLARKYLARIRTPSSTAARRVV